jgi:3-hydroxyacyl-CoA dehydrogenase/enoyl-CoA hydratase/3-hydroxybutyryl-CoA epimerase
MSNHVRISVLDAQSVYVLTFDRPNSETNILDLETLTELDDRLKAIAGDTGSRGVIFETAKSASFFGGEEVEALAGAASEKALRAVIELGQQVMARIAGLRPVTVSAIHGASIGGGFELCLATDYRLASPDPATRLALPAARFGILPCWGGVGGLARLIGARKALDVIAHSREFAAPRALAANLVDELIPREHLHRFALECVARGKPRRPGTGRCGKAALAGIVRDLRGNYPAATQAMAVIAKSAGLPMEQVLPLEAAVAVDLWRTPARRNLVRHAGMVKGAAAADGSRMPPIRRAAVIGAGVMGSAIAQHLSARQVDVILRDTSAERVLQGMAAAARIYRLAGEDRPPDERAIRAGMDRVTPAAEAVPLRLADVVIEAGPEDLETKAGIFAEIARLAGPRALLATTTATLSVTRIAESADGPERVVGLHFFHPVGTAPLVEVVTGEKTSEATMERAVDFVRKIGKLPVVVRDRPGFIVHRILTPYLMEAVLRCGQGAARDTIDECMMSFGMSAGPLRMVDKMGADVARRMATVLASALGVRMQAPDVLEAMCRDQRLGRAAGPGLHGRVRDPAAGRPQLHPDELQRRMVLLMVNEAARCVEDRVAQGPGHIDFAMVSGGGFPPFRGGPLRYADESGIAQVHEDLARYAREDGRFEPADILSRLAVENRTFYSD